MTVYLKLNVGVTGFPVHLTCQMNPSRNRHGLLLRSITETMSITHKKRYKHSLRKELSLVENNDMVNESKFCVQNVYLIERKKQ